MTDIRPIDAWIQHPTARFVAQPMFESLRRWMGIEEIPEGAIPVEMTLAMLDMAGIDRTLTCAWSSPTGPLISNDEVAGFVEASGGRLVGVGSVDLNRPMQAVAEIRRCVTQLGFVAIRILPWLWNLPPDDRRYYPVYVACCELGVPFCLQVGHTGPMAPSEPGRPIPYLDRVALEFPSSPSSAATSVSRGPRR